MFNTVIGENYLKLLLHYYILQHIIMCSNSRIVFDY